MFELIQTVDESVLRWIGAHLRVEWLNPVVAFYTRLGNGGMAFIALAVLLLFFRGTRKAAASAGVAMICGMLITNLTLKPLVARLRPRVVMEGWQTIVTSSDPHSFPSGHSTVAFAFAVALSAVLPQKWAKAAALTAAALMALSRLYVGVHFPSDVLVGVVIGTCCGLLGAWIVKRVSARCSRKAAG